jgi:hypothetical protein
MAEESTMQDERIRECVEALNRGDDWIGTYEE